MQVAKPGEKENSPDGGVKVAGWKLWKFKDPTVGWSSARLAR